MRPCLATHGLSESHGVNLGTRHLSCGRDCTHLSPRLPSLRWGRSRRDQIVSTRASASDELCLTRGTYDSVESARKGIGLASHDHPTPAVRFNNIVEFLPSLAAAASVSASFSKVSELQGRTQPGTDEERAVFSGTCEHQRSDRGEDGEYLHSFQRCYVVFTQITASVLPTSA